MTRSLVVASVVLAACEGASPDAPAAEDPGVVAERVARLVGERVRREMDCETTRARFACVVAQVPGEDFELPTTVITRVGLNYAVRPSRTVEDGAIETSRVARLDLGPDGISLLRLELLSDEALGVGELRTNAMLGSSGVVDGIDVPPPLVPGLEQAVTTFAPVERDEIGWRYTLDELVGRLWRVPAVDGRPAHWVAVEPVRGGDAGAFVTVVPDVPWRPAGRATPEPSPSPGGP